jgi:hypothetical protein
MDKYKFQVVLDVEVEAFDENDAEDVLRDIFGPGDDCGAMVTEFRATYVDESK